MIKIINDKFSSMDIKVRKILKYGIYFSLLVCILSIIILLTYHLNLIPNLFYIGLSVFRLGLFLVVEFIICALAIDTINKQINI